MRHGIIATGFLSLIALSAHAQGSAKLAVGPDAGGYLCPDGRKIWVSRCYDQSAQASCQVVHLHIKNNGLNPETAATRTELLASLKNCAVTPLEFTNNGVSLVTPKTPQNKPPATTPQPETYTVEVPLPKARTALVWVAASTDGEVKFYANELSVKPADKNGRIEAWLLAVYAKEIPDHPKARAAWQRYLLNCKDMTDSYETVMYLDVTGELLSLADAGSKVMAITKGSAMAGLASIACKTGPIKGERFATIGAAIEDALAPPVAAPARGTRLALVNASARNPDSTFYIDELSVKPSNSRGLTEVWVLQVFAKDISRSPGSRASWERYFVNCKDNLFGNNAAIDVDRTGKPLKTVESALDMLAVPKGSVAEWMTSTACKTASLSGQRLTTISDAIDYAYPPPPPPPADPFTVGSKTPPGPTIKTELFRIGSVANSVWYVDAETFDPVPNSVAVVGWVLRVFTKPDSAFPGSSAVWLRYHFGCGGNIDLGDVGLHSGILTKVEIDQTGKTRKTTTSNEDEAALRPIIEGTILEKLASTACYVDYPNTAPQVTAAAAIKDAAKPQ